MSRRISPEEEPPPSLRQTNAFISRRQELSMSLVLSAPPSPSRRRKEREMEPKRLLHSPARKRNGRKRGGGVSIEQKKKRAPSLSSLSMERFELVRLHRSLIRREMGERILTTEVVRVVVRIDHLSLQSRYGVELLDGGGTQPCEGSEHGPLDLCNLSVLDGVDQSILCGVSMPLQFLCSVFFSERFNFVELYIESLGHLLGDWSVGRGGRALRSGGGGGR
mmetsp:Transcript_44283/g.87401  ORF Transcript_44283/g.87401 Transcript_44283/m.87401 type:complete len:221 (-) Transcript_44283:605-1267(-)